MKKLTVPADKKGWERLASSIIKANLQLAGMRHSDLHEALAKLGVEQSTDSIAMKLSRGKFSAIFFLQCLAAIGVEQLSIPQRDQAGSAGAPEPQLDR
jgi:hypothetical protein